MLTEPEPEHKSTYSLICINQPQIKLPFYNFNKILTINNKLELICRKKFRLNLFSISIICH
jgi:hypothetical protein